MELLAIQMEMIMDLKREEWGDKLRLEEVWVGVMGCREEIQGERERERERGGGIDLGSTQELILIFDNHYYHYSSYYHFFVVLWFLHFLLFIYLSFC